MEKNMSKKVKNNKAKVIKVINEKNASSNGEATWACGAGDC